LDRWGEIQGYGATFLSLAEGLAKKKAMNTVDGLCEMFKAWQEDDVDSHPVDMALPHAMPVGLCFLKFFCQLACPDKDSY
jgi:hypothetical protein